MINSWQISLNTTQINQQENSEALSNTVDLESQQIAEIPVVWPLSLNERGEDLQVLVDQSSFYNDRADGFSVLQNQLQTKLNIFMCLFLIAIAGIAISYSLKR